MAYGWHLEAEYKDGYVHSEKELDDSSPYQAGANIYNDIVNDRPAADHGELVRFSLIGPLKRYDIDWTATPPATVPVYSRDMQATVDMATGEQTKSMVMQHFGYRYNEQGEPQEVIIDI